MSSILAAWAALTTIVGAPRTGAANNAAADAGTPHSVGRIEARRDAGTAAARISDEDREVLDNFDLLEHLDECKDLDLLIEISKST